MKNAMRRAAAAALLLVMLLTLLTGCGAKSGIKKTISEFESACQALDVTGMLECLNPTISKPIMGAMSLFGVENTDGLLDELVGVLGIFQSAGEDTEAFIQSIEITPGDYAFNADKSECVVSAELSYGEGNTKDITIEMVLKDEIWYISGIGF